MTTLLLFDVDGTLVSTGGAGRTAMARAFQDVCGSAEALNDIHFGGMTDRSILRIALEKLGRTFDDASFHEIVDVYLGHLGASVEASTGYVVMPSVRTVLDACAEAKVPMGLGTGNVRRGAEIKLQPPNLNAYFNFGGFGDDAEDRSELIRIAAQRGAAFAQAELADARVVVIGDTRRDIDAAHAIGAACVAVGTGGVALDELKGAELVVETLEDPRVLPFLLET